MKTITAVIFALVLFVSALAVSQKPAKADNEYPTCAATDPVFSMGYTDSEADWVYQDYDAGGILCTDPLGGIGGN